MDGYRKKSKVLYNEVLDEIVQKLSKRFNFDFNEAKRLFKKKFLTITIGDVAENDQNMEQKGERHKRGYNMEEMGRFRKKFEELGANCEWHRLNDGLNGTEYEGKAEEAVVLVIRGGVNVILGSETGANKMETELDKDEWMDKKVWSNKHRRVVNKNARWNNCFGPEAQEPDIENKKGRIIAYSQVPLLKKVVDWFLMMEKVFGNGDDVKLQGEGNYYYDEKCGIGAHGDAKTVGTNWKKSASLQLVHAAGAKKYMKQLER